MLIIVITPPFPGTGAEYCDERVCLSVSTRAYLGNRTSKLQQIFSARVACNGWVMAPSSSPLYCIDFNRILFKDKHRQLHIVGLALLGQNLLSKISSFCFSFSALN